MAARNFFEGLELHDVIDTQGYSVFRNQPGNLEEKQLLSGSAHKRSYLYAIKPSAETPVMTGQFEAENVASVRAGLAKLLGCRDLPEKTIIMDKADVDEEGEGAWQYVRMMLNDSVRRVEERHADQSPFREERDVRENDRPVENAQPDWSHIIRILILHDKWLHDADTGARAYLTGMVLTGIDLSGRDLSQAHLSYADLAGADLAGATMNHVNLVGANLRGANLRGANLENADFSDADLRGADLRDANLKGADFWRANIKGVVIEANALHKALECRSE